MASDDPIKVGKVRVVIATAKALLVQIEDCSEHWVPQSCIHEDSEVWLADDEGELVLKRWFAEKEGWEDAS